MAESVTRSPSALATPPGTVAVIGGGPAGSLAALLLARGGLRVTLFEQARYPRDKVCGECLSALGVEVLRRHGLTDAILVDGRRLRRARLFGATASAGLDLPSPMVGLSRAALDSRLLTAAVEGGVAVRQPARVEALESDATGVWLRVRDLAANAVTQFTVDYAIASDGRAVFATPRPGSTGDLGIKAHFVNVEADAEAVTLYGGVGCYGGVAPIEGDRWNVALSVPRAMVAVARGDVEAVWQAVRARSTAAARQFRSARRTSEWLASPLPRFAPLEHWPERVVPIGAAACAIEPIGGEGMGTALGSAELAAAAVLAGATHTLPAAYRTLWNRRGLFCRLGGVLLSDAGFSDGVAMARSPLIARVAMWAVGK